MKRLELIRHRKSHGCSLLRDRGKHSVYLNPATVIAALDVGPRDHREEVQTEIRVGRPPALL